MGTKRVYRWASGFVVAAAVRERMKMLDLVESVEDEVKKEWWKEEK